MPLLFHWRITKYDPALRNDQGHYPLGDWSCFSDVGKLFNGKPLTYQQYLTYENAYADCAVAFLDEANLDSLRVVHLDYIGNDNAAQCEGIRFAPSSLHHGSVVDRENLADIVRLNLREVLWCRLAAGDIGGIRFYLHFGWDLYMYIGSRSPSVGATHQSENTGLFVESMNSPYL